MNVIDDDDDSFNSKLKKKCIELNIKFHFRFDRRIIEK